MTISTQATPSAQQQLNLWWEGSRVWIESHWLQVGIAIAAGIAIYFILAMLRRWAMRRAAKAHGDLTLTEIVWRSLAKTKSLLLILASARMVAGYANPPELVFRTIVVLFTVAAVFQVAVWAREVVLGLIERRAAEGDHETLSNAMGIIRLLISFALFAVAAIVILGNLGVNVTGLVAGLGVGGIAIGLAAQGIFSDLFASLSIIFDRPFRVGETIRYDTTVGTVERIGLKSTRLRSIGGELLVISNTNLLSKEITNFAHLSRRRVELPVGVIYQTTPDKLRALPALLQAQIEAEGHEFIRSSFTGFGDSSLNFELLFDVHSAEYSVVTAARSAVGVRIFEAMTDAGYDFAYPTQTTFTSAPDGTMILPYAESVTVKPPKPAKPAKPKST